MKVVSYMIWNVKRDLFTFDLGGKDVTVLWFGVLFALGYLVAQQVLYYIYKKDGKSESHVDTLTLYLVLASLVGARLGQVLFYDLGKYIDKPYTLLKVWEGKLDGFGAAIGVLLVIVFYSYYYLGFTKFGTPVAERKFGLFLTRRNLPKESLLQVLDRIVLVASVAVVFVTLGSFINGDGKGKQTHSSRGVFMASEVSKGLRNETTLDEISYIKIDTPLNANGHIPAKILVRFKDLGLNDVALKSYIQNDLSFKFLEAPISQHIERGDALYYRLGEDEGSMFAVLYAYFIPRYPVQVYEALGSLILFIILFWMWKSGKGNRTGLATGIFLIGFFSLRFVLEFLRETQSGFEEQWPLHMAQFLCLPFIVGGILILLKKGRVS